MVPHEAPLSMLVGISLFLRNFESKTWAITVASSALVYGVIGVFALGVAIDVVLLVGAVVLGGTAIFWVRPTYPSIAAKVRLFGARRP